MDKSQGKTGASTVHIIQFPTHFLKVILPKEAEEKKTESELRERRSIQCCTVTAAAHWVSVWSTLHHALTYFALRTAQRVGTVSCLVRQKTEEHRGGIPSPFLFLTILYWLPGENYLLMADLSKSPHSIHTLCKSQSPTVSQNTLQGHNHLWKDVLISYSKALSRRH